jgi:DNA repair exonuclease SbcCD ATPase subunit
MGKRNSSNPGKIITGIVLVLSMFFMSGCGNSELEQKNIQLKRELSKMERFNTSLTASLEKVTKENNNLKKALEKLRENNNGLNVSLAKSELEFSKKHKAELDAEKQKLNDEREAFRQEKVSIEKTAYENAKQTVSTMYLFIIGLIMIVLLIIFILLVKNKKDNKKVIEEKNADIEEIQFKNDKIKKSLKEKDERIIALENQIKDLERLQKSNSKNQVVQKIEEYTRKREQKLDRLEGDRHGK